MEGNLRTIANPLSLMRSDAILENAIIKMAKAMAELTKTFANVNLVSDKEVDEKVTKCMCTQKCATKVCPCRKIQKKCNASCHPTNYNCTNAV